MLNSATIIEMEAKNPRGPKSDAEAKGPHILEIGTLEPVLRTQPQRSLAELEGWNRRIPELEGERRLVSAIVYSPNGQLLAYDTVSTNFHLFHCTFQWRKNAQGRSKGDIVGYLHEQLLPYGPLRACFDERGVRVVPGCGRCADSEKVRRMWNANERKIELYRQIGD